MIIQQPIQPFDEKKTGISQRTLPTILRNQDRAFEIVPLRSRVIKFHRSPLPYSHTILHTPGKRQNFQSQYLINSLLLLPIISHPPLNTQNPSPNKLLDSSHCSTEQPLDTTSQSFWTPQPCSKARKSSFPLSLLGVCWRQRNGFSLARLPLHYLCRERARSVSLWVGGVQGRVVQKYYFRNSGKTCDGKQPRQSGNLWILFGVLTGYTRSPLCRARARL